MNTQHRQASRQKHHRRDPMASVYVLAANSEQPKDWTDAFPNAEKYLKPIAVIAAILLIVLWLAFVQPYVGF